MRLVSVNIERSKHLLRVVELLAKRRPDVVCIQELMERDIPLFQKLLDAPCIYAPFTRHQAEGDPGVMGIGTFSNLPIRSHSIDCYAGDMSRILNFDVTSSATKHATENHSVVFCDVEKDGKVFRIGATHFCWTPHGDPDEFQRRDIKRLLGILAAKGEFVLVGDFNAPRGGEIFSELAMRYKDNIPAHYGTSIDASLHRNGKKRPHELRDKMVDGLFTTPAYRASNVELVFGVSDHAAVVGDITSL